MPIRRDGICPAAPGMAVEWRHSFGGHRCNIDRKVTSRPKRQEKASRLIMQSQQTSGFFASAQLAGRGSIAVLGICIGVSYVACGGFVAAAQVTDSPVSEIQSLVRSEQYNQALQLTKSQLHTKPNRCSAVDTGRDYLLAQGREDRRNWCFRQGAASFACVHAGAEGRSSTPL